MTTISGPSLFPDFNEASYLEANPDVNDAIAAGLIPSAIEHYNLWGQYENRPGAFGALGRGTDEQVAGIPPEILRLRVGSMDARLHEVIGATVANDILTVLAQYNVQLTPDTRIFDFGCGSGRVVRHLAPKCSCLIDASDIDVEAIAWAKNNMPDSATWHVNQEMPPLEFEGGTFDIVYATSVFTHFPEEMQFKWLEELRRIVKPNAWLLLSVSGKTLIPPGNPDAIKFDADGFCFVRGVPTYGLPDFYRAAFHTEQYVRREWSKFFHIEAFTNRSLGGAQDLVIARPK